GGEIGALVDVFLHHRRDFRGVLVAHLRVAEAGQVAQRERIVHGEEVEASCAARSLAGARESLDARERVEERALADVGAAGECDLGAVPSRASVEREGRRDEFCRETNHRLSSSVSIRGGVTVVACESRRASSAVSALRNSRSLMPRWRSGYGASNFSAARRCSCALDTSPSASL